MTFRYTKRFVKQFKRLPAPIKKRANKSLDLLLEGDERYPSLHFKRVSQKSEIWSVRVNKDYRMLAFRDGEDVEWFWVGPHDQYDKLLDRLD